MTPSGIPDSPVAAVETTRSVTRYRWRLSSTSATDLCEYSRTKRLVSRATPPRYPPVGMFNPRSLGVGSQENTAGRAERDSVTTSRSMARPCTSSFGYSLVAFGGLVAGATRHRLASGVVRPPSAWSAVALARTTFGDRIGLPGYASLPGMLFCPSVSVCWWPLTRQSRGDHSTIIRRSFRKHPSVGVPFKYVRHPRHARL